MRNAEENLREAIAPLCAPLGLELFDVEVHERTVQVTLEGPGLVGLESLADAARSISAFLDAHDELAPAGRYELEVTSPGVERRLRRREHFEASMGATVALRLVAGTEGPRRLEGVLCAVEADRLVLRAPGGAEDTVALAAVERAHTVFDWRGALAEHKSTARTRAGRAGASARRAGSGKEHAR